jgi:hypothetical protein
MTGVQLAVFATLVATVVGVWVTLFLLLPLVARARFQYRATVLRDECWDAVLDKRLRRTEAVESFLARASAMAAYPEMFTLTRALAAQLAIAELGCEIVVEQPSYASLRPEERKLLHRLDEELYRALGQRLVRGSSFGWLLWGGLKVGSLMLPSKRHSKVVSATSPQNLARQYTAISEKVPIKGRRLVSLGRQP